MVVLKHDNLDDQETGIETLVDQILNLFDQYPTLGGTCQMSDAAGVPLAPISTPDKQYVLFLIELTAKVAIDLTFNFGSTT
jgi:hypothetical protein